MKEEDLISNLMAIAFLAIIISFIKIRKNKYIFGSGIEREYISLMEDISQCESLSELIKLEPRIKQFEQHSEGKSEDSNEAKMVNSINEYYDEIYDNVIVEHYGF